PGGGFSIMMQTAIIIGVVIALPVIVFQAWLFLSPALHRHEKKVVLPVILGAVLLFVAGAALAWYFVLPMTLRFLTSMGDEAFDQMISANEYFGFVTSLVLAMGAVFELPIAILALSALGLVTPQFLAKFRRHAVIGSYLVAAIITPGDLFVTSVALMVPLYLLYELSIVLSWIVFRRRSRKQAAEALEDGGIPA
ncbi:MAG: Sec-independent protein translocase, TatC subunit, partial [Gemmatimonadetes bacterium]|nr:Sec-independent protein translocase, TatC subunit [Gemmatimonadota bacterium]